MVGGLWRLVGGFDGGEADQRAAFAFGVDAPVAVAADRLRLRRGGRHESQQGRDQGKAQFHQGLRSATSLVLITDEI
jgi:hypothetical protein